MKFTRFFTVMIGGWMALSSISLGYSGGTGEPNTPYQIADVIDFLELAADTGNYDKYFILTADIDLDPNLPSGQVFTSAVIATDTETIAGFQGTQFTGSFDGNSHTIFNLTIATSEKDYIGLFGSISQGQIQNLRLKNITVTGGNHVGGLAGYISKSSISNCHLTGVITGNGSLCLGGLAGFITGSTITDCHSNIALGGTGSNAGGLAGSSFGNSIICNCSATGAIIDNDPNGLNFSVGGLVGNNCSSTITHCLAAGDVTVISTNADFVSVNVGGIAGEDRYGTITDSYATGSINTVITSESAITCSGGLVGLNSSKGMSDSYARGAVLFNCSTQSDYFIGGMLGLNYEGMINCCYSGGMVDSSGNPDADNCVGGFCGQVLTDGIYDDTANFWDNETSGRTISAMGLGKTTAQMQTLLTFTSDDWDFENTWAICEGTNYPRLQWQIPSGDWACPDGVGAEDLSALTSCWMETVQAKSDINDDDVVNFEDVLRLSQNWLLAGCGTCNDADITDDGNVDELDLGLMTDQWLLQINSSCQMTDLNEDGRVDLEDWTIFAEHWLDM